MLLLLGLCLCRLLGAEWPVPSVKLAVAGSAGCSETKTEKEKENRDLTKSNLSQPPQAIWAPIWCEQIAPKNLIHASLLPTCSLLNFLYNGARSAPVIGPCLHARMPYCLTTRSGERLCIRINNNAKEWEAIVLNVCMACTWVWGLVHVQAVRWMRTELMGLVAPWGPRK